MHWLNAVIIVQVFLPSGDAVYVQREARAIVSGFINVWVVASSSALNNTGGQFQQHLPHIFQLIHLNLSLSLSLPL